MLGMNAKVVEVRSISSGFDAYLTDGERQRGRVEVRSDAEDV